MIIYLAKYLSKYYSLFNIFSYFTLRITLSLLTSLFISLSIGNYIISYLKKISFNQFIRKDGPASHAFKNKTPTMGGIIILITIIISVLLWVDLLNSYVWYVLTILLSYGIIGFIDDYRKIVNKSTKGLPAIWKYIFMSLIAFIVSFLLYITSKDTQTTELIIPFFNNFKPQLGLFYILIAYFVIVGTGNAVNLTDGLDGLAIVPIIFVSIGFAIIAFITSNINFARDLNMPYLCKASELVIICTIIIGSGLGFLWFNTYPAQIFMGDIGSLSLGGTLGTIGVLLRQELLLIIMGGIFVIETVSVILQVIFFKLRGIRIFSMAPIHHHYEIKGCPEPRIIVRFWIISLIFMLISLAIIKVK